MNRRHAHLLFAALSFASVTSFATSPAIARGKVRVRGVGLSRGARPTGPVMSQAELRSCVLAERRLNAQSDEIESDEARLQKSQTDIEALERTIEVRRSKVDEYSQESVDAFNALISRHRNLART